MSIVSNARAIVGALQPLMGPYASGSLIAQAPGDETMVAPGTVAIPLRGGQLDEQAAVFVQKNPATEDGCWTVPAGSSLAIPVHSLQGGLRPNMAAGTIYRWEPPVEGLGDTALADAGGLTGGDFSGAYAGLKQVVIYRQMTTASVQELFRAQAGVVYPAAVLCRSNVQPLDGPSSPTGGPRTARVGQGKLRSRINWILFLLSMRLDTDQQRRDTGDTLLEDVIDRLTDQTYYRGLQLSQSPGLQIQDARVLSTNPVYCDAVLFSTLSTFQRHSDAEFPLWLKTRIRQQTPTQPNPPDPDLPAIDLPDQTLDHS